MKNAKRKTASVKGKSSMTATDRVLSVYKSELGKYEQTLDVTMRCSLMQHGIQTDGRGIRAVKIFTRQTLVGISLKRVLPLAHAPHDAPNPLWDVCSVASLTRNLLEGYVTLFYAGLETITMEEAEFRFLLGQYHRNREWRDIRLKKDSADPGLGLFNEGLPEQMARLKAHPFFQELSDDQRRKVAKGQETYLSKAEIEQRAPVVGNYRMYYQLLSNLVHPLPFSIERIDNDRGRGGMSEPDIHFCIMCVTLATKFLAASTVGIADLFPMHFGEKLANLLNKIRPYMEGP